MLDVRDKGEKDGETGNEDSVWENREDEKEKQWAIEEQRNFHLHEVIR